MYLMHWLYWKSRNARRQVTLVFTANNVKNDVILCKIDVNVKNRMPVAGSVGFFKLSRNSSKEKCYFITSFILKIKCGKSKGMQEKVSIMGVECA